MVLVTWLNLIPGPLSQRGTNSSQEPMDWAVSAVAVRALTDATGTIREVRVAPKPWRSREAEAALLRS